MKRSISNNKKSPINNNEDEVNIDVNLLLNDPKSLHKMLNKKSDDNDYVPTGANPNKLSNRPKNPIKVDLTILMKVFGEVKNLKQDSILS